MTPLSLLRLFFLLALASLALVAAGCGGDDDGDGDSAEPTPTATATRTATPTPDGGDGGTTRPEGIDVEAVGRAFDRLTTACRRRARDEDARSDARLNRRLRAAVDVHIEAFRENPDKAYRREPGRALLSMRQRLRALNQITNSACGGDDLSRSLSRRLAREARSS
jgi:hypothetical protein